MADASAQLREIALALRAAGDRDNLNALRRGIRAGAAPLIPAVRDAARRQLPKRGGLNEYEASQNIRVAVLTGARSAGVRIVGKASVATDSGTWRHPTFGRRGRGQWRTETFADADGWWSATLAHRSPAVAPVVESELELIAAKIRAL